MSDSSGRFSAGSADGYARGMTSQRVYPAPSGTGCVDCLATDSWWLHLRRCVECGHIGCCDSSPNQHASQHATDAKHPVIRSFEPGEDWCWSYQTDDFIAGPDLPDPQHRPEEQGSPAPAERVPADWESRLH